VRILRLSRSVFLVALDCRSEFHQSPSILLASGASRLGVARDLGWPRISQSPKQSAARGV
jgi:hypothetical protein